jgi:branched-chain amino acid transport system ATP-binding protein
VTTSGGVADAPASTAATPAVLTTRDLTWGVGGFTILEDISLDVRRGEFLSIIGPNGAGKTSLLNVISGVHVPRSGRVELDGRDITRMRPAHRVRRGLGRTFQTSSLFPGLRVAENARLAAQAARGGSLSLLSRPRHTDAATAAGYAALSEVGLAERAEDPVADLSHGDKRKLEIALLLCSGPEVLLLDEPTAGVSVEEVEPLVDVIRQVHDGGRTIVMVEHRMELVVGASDRIAVLHNGRLLTVGDPDSVMADPTVQSAYLGET